MVLDELGAKRPGIINTQVLLAVVRLRYFDAYGPKHLTKGSTVDVFVIDEDAVVVE